VSCSRRRRTPRGHDRRRRSSELGERDRGAGGDVDRRDPVSSVVVRRRHDWPTATRRRVVGATAAVRRDVGEPVVGLVAVIDAGNPQHAPSLSVVVAHRYSPSAVAVLHWQVGPTCRHGSRARDAPLLISKSSLALRTTSDRLSAKPLARGLRAKQQSASAGWDCWSSSEATAGFTSASARASKRQRG